RGARLQAKRDQSALAIALSFHIGETTAAGCLGARDIRSRNFHIEAIAAAVSLIIIERLVGVDRDPRSFRRITRPKRGDVSALSGVLIALCSRFDDEDLGADQ